MAKRNPPAGEPAAAADDTANAPDTPPPVTPREARDIARATVISTADVDAAGALWAKHAGPEWAGLWAAGHDKG